MHRFWRMAKFVFCVVGSLIFFSAPARGQLLNDDIQIAVAPVPEPSTLAFVGLGLLVAAGISFVRRSPK